MNLACALVLIQPILDVCVYDYGVERLERRNLQKGFPRFCPEDIGCG